MRTYHLILTVHYYILKIKLLALIYNRLKYVPANDGTTEEMTWSVSLS